MSSRSTSATMTGRRSRRLGAEKKPFGWVRHSLDTPWRAVVGALIVTVSTIGLFRAADGRRGQRETTWTVATRALVPGAVLRRSDLATIRLDLSGTTLAAEAFPRPEMVVGDVLRAPLAKGELVQRSDVSLLSGQAALGSDVLSLPVERAFALDGDLRAGERVELVELTGGSAHAGKASAPTPAQVLAVASSSSLLSGHATIVVTLALRSGAPATALLAAARRDDVAVMLPVPGTPPEGGATAGA